MSIAHSVSGFEVELPRSLKAERRDDIAILTLTRVEKRNALNDPTVFGIEAFFDALPADVKAVVLNAEGEHFSAGLDLTELTERNVTQGISHSRSWHRAFDRIEFGKVPVVAVLHGAVVGGGLELAAATHVRVAERSTYYALPEGTRGIFVGGGGSVRIPRLIGTSRMMEMMLTGRTYDAEDGQALGISHYLVAAGRGARQRNRARPSHRGQRAHDQFRRHACPAAHCRAGPRQRLSDRGADRVDRARGRGGQGAAQGIPGKARAQDGA